MRRSAPARGFTLVEVVTALLIVSLAVAVAVPAFRTSGQDDDLTKARRRVETLFRLARDSAIRSGVPVTVILDSVQGLAWIDTAPMVRIGSEAVREALAYPDATPEPGEVAAMHLGTSEALAPGQFIGLPPTVHMQLPRARARFRFEPTGAALADTLLLSGAFGTRAVIVDPWTGDVTVR
jgi:prepilin-type N-terminal cleavage/methylation domain-containing protein